jgi:hypothetical protein
MKEAPRLIRFNGWRFARDIHPQSATWWVIRVVFDLSRHVRYPANLRPFGVANSEVGVIQAPRRPRIMRYELRDFEWIAIRLHACEPTPYRCKNFSTRPSINSSALPITSAPTISFAEIFSPSKR